MKLNLLQRHLKKEKIELVILIHPDINITYFTQINPSFAILVVTPHKAELYLTNLDERPSLAKIALKTLRQKWEKEFKNPKIKRVGINNKSLTIASFHKLKHIYPKAKFWDISSKLEELREIKTQEEISKIKRACEITDSVFNKVVTQLKHHRVKTEQKIVSYLDQEIRARGGEFSFPPIVASGKNSAIPHYKTGNKKLAEGFLLLDFGVKYNHYCSDLSRTLFLGTPSEQERNRYLLVAKEQEEIIKQLEVGKSFTGLEQSFRSKLGKLSSHFTHSLGHGIGLEVHERPSYHDKKNKICNNQVFTVEPGIYFPGKCGVRIEDTILFDGRARILTKSGKRLITIPF